MQLENVRRDYQKGGLRRDKLNQNPFTQFELWMQQAMDAELKDPTAMTLATSDQNGAPSQRIVLLKHFDEAGFVFFTNYASQKANDIDANCHVSLHFPWQDLERQVSIKGRAEKLSVSESESYFLSRPRESQLAAWASRQSAPIASRKVLQSRYKRMEVKFEGAEISLPDFWGGYRVVPFLMEFWQGGANRLHDRFEYCRRESTGNTWSIQRISP